ncbi:J domain-containing protein [Roseiarcaceae bacterium H3SJ34-1]|uniref:hypothetical protein n=1 Tax=Terripilifer ovatus TaxID=3032367 RepID=UPI003AB985E8|nr:J domain-containing protein [Roseiarcaceae bacterium H3SJ34-1]
MAALMRIRELPGDIVLLLRILADDADAVQEARRLTGLNSAAILMISELYVKEVLLFAGAPPRRVLGLSPNADRAEARTNLRFLLSWLHPDRNPSKWQSAFATRVIAAWRLVKDAEIGQDPGQSSPRPVHAQRRVRLPWIALPVANASTWPRLHVSTSLFMFLVGAALLLGLVVPNSAAFTAYQNLVTAILDDDPGANFLPSENSALNEDGSRK